MKSKLKKVRELEIKYNFLFRETWGNFPYFVDERYGKFCISKGITPKRPSIKCGYITNWKDYGQTVDEVINFFEYEINNLKYEQQQIRFDSSDGLLPFERNGGYMAEMVG